ncbi:hypothetical protein SFUMM280S_08205 [Streptomyces fumanus]
MNPAARSGPTRGARRVARITASGGRGRSRAVAGGRGRSRASRAVVGVAGGRGRRERRGCRGPSRVARRVPPTAVPRSSCRRHIRRFHTVRSATRPVGRDDYVRHAGGPDLATAPARPGRPEPVSRERSTGPGLVLAAALETGARSRALHAPRGRSSARHHGQGSSAGLAPTAAVRRRPRDGGRRRSGTGPPRRPGLRRGEPGQLPWLTRMSRGSRPGSGSSPPTIPGPGGPPRMITPPVAPHPGATDARPYPCPRRLPRPGPRRRPPGRPGTRRTVRRGRLRRPGPRGPARPGRAGCRPRRAAERRCHRRPGPGRRHRRHLARQRGGARSARRQGGGPERPLPGRLHHEGRHGRHRAAAGRPGPRRPGRADPGLPPRPVHPRLEQADHRTAVARPHQRHQARRRARHHLRGGVRPPLRHPLPAPGGGLGARGRPPSSARGRTSTT